MFIPVGDTYLIWSFLQGGLPHECSTALGFAGAIGDADEAELALQLMVSELNGFFPDTVTFTGGEAKVGQDGTDPLTFPVAFSSVGQISADGDPPQVSTLVQKRTARGGRSGRGRCYLPAPPNDQTTAGGGLEEAWRSDVEDAYVAGVTAIATDSGLSLSTPLLFHEAAEEGDVITSFAVANRVATQRRRLR